MTSLPPLCTKCAKCGEFSFEEQRNVLRPAGCSDPPRPSLGARALYLGFHPGVDFTLDPYATGSAMSTKRDTLWKFSPPLQPRYVCGRQLTLSRTPPSIGSVASRSLRMTEHRDAPGFNARRTANLKRHCAASKAERYSSHFTSAARICGRYCGGCRPARSDQRSGYVTQDALNGERVRELILSAHR